MMKSNRTGSYGAPGDATQKIYLASSWTGRYLEAHLKQRKTGDIRMRAAAAFSTVQSY
jgi:hypothetical protein